MTQLAYLKVHTIGGIRVSDASRFLKIMIEAYQGLLTLEEITAENNATLIAKEPDVQPEIFCEDDELILSSVRFSSRGYCEFLGREKPLQAINQYLNTRFERCKGKEGEKIEQEGMLIETGILSLDLVKDAIATSRAVDFSEIEIGHVIKEYALIPLLKLDNFQDIGVISKAELSRVEE